MYSLPWADANLSPFDPAATDKAKIEAGHPVPCRLCEAVYRVLTLTMRFCSTCERAYCQTAHGGWVGRRGVCVQCGPLQPRVPQQQDLDAIGVSLRIQDTLRGPDATGVGKVTLPVTRASQGQRSVPFAVFWGRLQEEFGNAPMSDGQHVLEVQNWTQDHPDLPDSIRLFWEPERNTVLWRTRDNNLRQFSAAEARKVYEVWHDYRAGRTIRSFITNTLGVQNSKPIIALFKRFEHLMT